jgi:hypothetical protein
MPQNNRLTPDYTYDERAARYREVDTGRFASGKAILSSLNGVIDASQANITGLTQSLMDGNITVSEWQAGMASEIKLAHVASAAAAKGGWAQMSQADWGRAGQMIRRQYQYLQGFANEIESGKQPLNGRALVRAKLYAQAARGTYEQIRRHEMEVLGNNEERRVLGAAEHCQGCIGQAAKGWQPIGTLDPIGAEECVTNCQCHFEYRIV